MPFRAAGRLRSGVDPVALRDVADVPGAVDADVDVGVAPPVCGGVARRPRPGVGVPCRARTPVARDLRLRDRDDRRWSGSRRRCCRG